MTSEQKRRLHRDGLRFLAVVAVLTVAALCGWTDWWPAIASAFTSASVLAIRLIDQHQERKAARHETARGVSEPHPSRDVQ